MAYIGHFTKQTSVPCLYVKYHHHNATVTSVKCVPTAVIKALVTARHVLSFTRVVCHCILADYIILMHNKAK